MAEKVVSRVTFEIGQIDQLFVTYAALLDYVHQRAPDIVELAALASVLHSFYNGLENIFLSIAGELDQQAPTGSQWHRDLVIQMTHEMANRRSIISAELAQRLTDYLAFRHFYRHSYSFSLEWGKLKELVTPLREVWTQVKEELGAFLKGLNSAENSSPKC